eukprot:scaffold293596_cov28-Tisochrysis_lutea.AAC.1
MGARHAITALAGLAFVVCAIQFGAFAALRGAIAQRPASARSRLREKQPGRGGEDSWAEALRGWDPTLEPDPPGDTDLPETGRKQGERRRRDEDETRSTAAAEGKREGMGTAPAGCARVRSGRLLLYAAHSGVGNQVRARARVLRPLGLVAAINVGPIMCLAASWSLHLLPLASGAFSTPGASTCLRTQSHAGLAALASPV